jgi:Carboxypeptidase controlling helical cell shape catalytic/C-terminal domain of metallo-carboxypeptidase
MKNRLLLILISLLAISGTAYAEKPLEFTLHKLESDNPGKTLLVVGGIQGDEPGGFNAAALMVTRYSIRKGSVWVVPNLNFISIVHRTRGLYGDLNRKFNRIKDNDPEFDTIARIKRIIMDQQVDAVLNLHDGSGFFHPDYIDETRNPERWGQSIIIDQERIDAGPYGYLGAIARYVAADVNRQLYAPGHAYHVKNTNTWKGNAEMLKTLTYFATRNLKPAFGVEASKSFPTHQRTFYHLSAVEAFMDLLDIAYERDFELSLRDVDNAIRSDIKLALYNSKILLDVENARNRLPFIPLKKSSEIEFISSNPLIAVVSSGNSYRIFHGNRRMTRIFPEYFEYDWSINGITMSIDGKREPVNFGEMVYVEKSFSIMPQQGYRVNIIGFKSPEYRNESGIQIRLNDIHKRFSMDKEGRIFRVEVYQNKKFSGMVLVNFDRKPDGLQPAVSRILSLKGHPPENVYND